MQKGEDELFTGIYLQDILTGVMPPGKSLWMAVGQGQWINYYDSKANFEYSIDYGTKGSI